MIRNDIYIKELTDPAYDPPGYYDNLTDDQAEAHMNANSQFLFDSAVNHLGVLNILGAEAGGKMLDDLTTAGVTIKAVKWAMDGIFVAGINLGNPETRQMLVDLSANSLIDPDAAQILLDAGEHKSTIAIEILLTEAYPAEVCFARNGEYQ